MGAYIINRAVMCAQTKQRSLGVGHGLNLHKLMSRSSCLGAEKAIERIRLLNDLDYFITWKQLGTIHAFRYSGSIEFLSFYYRLTKSSTFTIPSI